MNFLKKIITKKLTPDPDVKKAYLHTLICLSLFTTPVIAESDFFKLPENVQVHGFLSQSFYHTTDNNFLGESDDRISADFRELGLNASWRVLPELQIAAQVVWRNAGITDEDKLRLDYGYANYTFYSSESSLLGIKGGRVPIPYGLYNDTRDVAATRPGIYLPQSIYFDRNRNFSLSADGGYLHGEHRTDYGDFFFHSGVIIPRTDDPQINQSIRGPFHGELKGDASWVTQVNYELQGGKVRLGATYGDFNLHLNPGNAPTNPTTPGDFRFNLWIFSAQYNAENWSLTGEYAIRHSRLKGFFFPDSNIIGESYYIQGTYKLTSKLEAMFRYDALYWDRNDRNGRDFSKTFGVPFHSRFAKDFTAGLRLEVLPSLLVSAEYHNVDGTGWLASIENTKGSKRYWSLFSLQVSYNF